MTILEVCLYLPLFFVLILIFIENKNIKLIKVISLYGFFVIFFVSILMILKFNYISGGYQFLVERPLFKSLNVSYILGVDGISILFILLLTLLMPICLLASWTYITYKVKEFCIVFFILEFCLIGVFSVLDIFLFYIFFESVLIPMFLIIGVWGSRDRKIHATYQFFLYTLLGSLFMLLGILVIYYDTGSTNWFVIVSNEYSKYREIVVWLSFFCSFCVKVPMIPVHIWLPEAHVEAPTAGSVILAGILLKLGVYGLIRFSIPMFYYATQYYTPLVYTMSLISIVYASCTTIRQIDLKKVIAYSSVAHMNYVTLGVMSCNIQGIEGSIYLMLGHGLVSSGLFLCVGLLYERYGTRIIKYYGSLVFGMPIFGIIFLVLTLANIGFPGLSNFVGEFLVILGLVKYNIIVGILSMIGVVLSIVYSLWLYNRVVFGVFKTEFIYHLSDLNFREFYYFLFLIICILFSGMFPNILLNLVHHGTLNIIL